MNFEEELPTSITPPPEERLQSFAELLKEAKAQKHLWKSKLHQLLKDFKWFLTEKPNPPASWTERLGAQASKYDYHQIVLPEDYTDPYKDELENLALLQEKFAGSDGFIALDYVLVTRNIFLYYNSHLKPIELPKPLAMFESVPESKDIEWDCTLTVFTDGSWHAYNMDRDEDEMIGEDIGEELEKWLPILGKMRVIIPEEGKDFGLIGPRDEDEPSGSVSNEPDPIKPFNFGL